MENFELKLIDMSRFDVFLSGLSDILKLPNDQCCVVFLLGLTYPLSFSYRFIDRPFLRHLWGIIFGLIFQFLVYREWILIWWMPQILTYFILVVLGKNATFAVILCNFAVLEWFQVYRYYYQYLEYNMSVEIILMCGMMKLVSFSINFYDGKSSQGNDNYFNDYASKITKIPKLQKQIAKQTKELSFHELPSFFEYIGYLNFFYTGVLGPYIDYRDYKNWIEKKEQYKQIPFALFPIIKLVAQIIGFGYLYTAVYPDYKPNILLTKEWLELPFVTKIYMIQWMSFLLRCRYHFVWHMIQTNFVLSGIGYGKDEHGNDRWDYIIQQDSRLELPFKYALRDRMNMWNVQGTKFFRLYVYYRLMASLQNSFLCMWLVFFVNAVWHGVYPAYFLVTFSTSIIIESHKCCFRFYNNVMVKIIKPEILANYIAHFSSQFYCYCMCAIAFIQIELFEFQACYVFNSGIYFVGQILPLSIVLFFKITGLGQRSVSLQKIKDGKKEK